MTLKEIIKQRILILDGAMGTEIQQFRLSERDFRGERFRGVKGMMSGNNDMLNLTRPGVIREIHRRYLEAGADLITTNTFSSQRVSQADYHLENFAREMAFEGARIARSMADEYAMEEKEAQDFLKEANQRFIPLFNQIGIDFSIQYSTLQDLKKRFDFANAPKRFEYLKRYE